MPPCNWNVDLSSCPGMANHADQDSVTLARDMAVDVIWALSGRRFGLCEVTVRPVPYCPPEPGLVAQAFAYSRTGPRRAGYGPPAACCPPPLPRYITLAGPAESIVEVIIDGTIIDPATYQLSANRLFRLGDATWPTGQDFSAAPGQPGTWTVAYRQGLPVPKGGLHAAAALACEMFKGLLGQPCKLPDRVTDIVREGVSMTVLDPGDFLDKGRTGITAVDLWLASVNPNGLATAATVWTPDVPPPHPVV